MPSGSGQHNNTNLSIHVNDIMAAILWCYLKWVFFCLQEKKLQTEKQTDKHPDK
jgi:hypothetical protein